MSGLPRWQSGKESISNAGVAEDECVIPGLGRSPGGGHGNLLQYSCLENPTDRGIWWVTAHGAVESDTTENVLPWMSVSRHSAHLTCWGKGALKEKALFKANFIQEKYWPWDLLEIKMFSLDPETTSLGWNWKLRVCGIKLWSLHHPVPSPHYQSK